MCHPAGYGIAEITDRPRVGSVTKLLSSLCVDQNRSLCALVIKSSAKLGRNRPITLVGSSREARATGLLISPNEKPIKPSR
jgi:hypothetical protein